MKAKVLVTGSNGFIGKNLLIQLAQNSISAVTFTSADSFQSLNAIVNEVDFIFHLAGVNRPEDEAQFELHNHALTKALCTAVIGSGRSIPILFASSTQAILENPYGVSKKLSEDALIDLGNKTGSPIYIYRLPNVFGKWARPNYNSVVATFCYNISQNIKIQINDPQCSISLVYIDSVVDEFLSRCQNPIKGTIYPDIKPVYSITLEGLAKEIEGFKVSRETLIIPRVGSGLTRALYSTYLSYLTPSQFRYILPVHKDSRGEFVEILKTKDSGQFSFFTAHPGVTRGGHFHHSKTEKFLVLQGEARFRFRHILTNESTEIFVNGFESEVVETIPGWAHEITNVGNEKLIVMLWANEIFNYVHPDTFAMKV